METVVITTNNARSFCRRTNYNVPIPSVRVSRHHWYMIITPRWSRGTRKGLNKRVHRTVCTPRDKKWFFFYIYILYFSIVFTRRA